MDADHTSSPDRPGPPPTGIEARVQIVVEDFLAALQAREQPDRAQFVAGHPELAPWLDERLKLVELELTQVLASSEAGDPHAAEQLLPLVYGELRKLAAQKLASEEPGQTLEPTALVHEAYLRLVGHDGGQHWDHRGHFFAAAAEAMRRILIENARRKRGLRRGGDRQRIDADLNLFGDPAPAYDLLALDEALCRLERESPVRAELVKLRFFAGLTVPEAAKILGISVATAERYWTYARTWLFTQLHQE